ncbi:copper amine oxidase N-terminal domain-containing protein [Paenibacillus thalictri]|uniref:Copper amine oxidase N-terminal domain-containing protein n=1 Tax=Paenibacillus thalictri TaxID=2527873 RepID=A0A4Q9DHK1_9BACL|nr:copper amine oxidase N-terminal domain-containing protein [Paenibacillus thalictri]TBL70905.1 copper amine oxidase N-terminal domain-containing protein [Paenibacillus thalictri]
MNPMKKAAAVSVLSLALMLPGIAQANEMMMKPAAGEMGTDMGSSMSTDMSSGMMNMNNGMAMDGKMMGTGSKAEMMMNGTTYVPLRMFAETLGYKVIWNGDERSITMTYMNMGMDKGMGTAMPDKTGQAMMDMKDMYMVKIMLDSKDIMIGMDKNMLKNAPMLMDGEVYVTQDFIPMYLLAPFMMKSM